MSKFISPRTCARISGVAFKDMRADLEAFGVRMVLICKRLRVDEDDFEAFLDASRVATRAETQNRADLLEQLAAEKVLGR